MRAKWKITNTSHIQYIGIVVRRNTRAPLTEAESVVFILVYTFYRYTLLFTKRKQKNKVKIRETQSDRKSRKKRIYSKGLFIIFSVFFSFFILFLCRRCPFLYHCCVFIVFFYFQIEFNAK